MGRGRTTQFTTIDDLKSKEEFGRRLFVLGARANLIGPKAIAAALYENDECYKLVLPKKAKYEVTKKKDIASIARSVNRHFHAESAISVSGNYLKAYTVLFSCSYDYLYERIDEPAPDAEIEAMREKLNLSVDAIVNLSNNIVQAEWWSHLLESGLFTELPAGWEGMFDELVIKHYRGKGAKPDNEIIDELRAKNKLDQMHLIMHPAYKARIDAETAESAYYGRLAKIQSMVTDYFIQTTMNAFENRLS